MLGPMNGTSRWLVTLGLVLGAPASVYADEPPASTAPTAAPTTDDAPASPPPETLSRFYRELVRPSRRRAAVHLQLALEALDANTYGRRGRGSHVSENVITRLRLARIHAPDDPEIVYQLGIALADGIPMRAHRSADQRIGEAIETFEHLRRLDPGYETFDVGTELAILYTRRGEFRAAMDEYERALPEALDDAALGVVLANYAEVSMEAGDLVGAVDRYERALAHEARVGQSSHGLALIAFGLAVALDRLGESEPAIERAHQAVMAAGGTLDVLTSSEVFFEPPEELRYYQMLGELAIARFASTPAERIAHLAQALAHVRRFLDEGGADGPYAEVALARRQAIEAELDRRRAATRPAPATRPTPRTPQRSPRPRR